MRLALAVVAGLLAAAGPAAAADYPTGVDRASCGPGSRPEPKLQGEVPLDDRESGRSKESYTCNLELAGTFAGNGASYQMAWHGRCAYYDTAFSSRLGVQVLDVGDPAKPLDAGTLTSPAMLGSWESLKVAESRGLLAAVSAWNGQGPPLFEVYDVGEDCAKPRLVSSTTLHVGTSHTGNWSADGKTYYAMSRPSQLNAIDVSEPNAPRLIGSFPVGAQDHDMSTSEDGTRGYVAVPQQLDGSGNGLAIVDLSQVQERRPNPQAPVIGRVSWTDGQQAQMTIPVTIRGRPYVVHVDELGNGAARLIDIADETKPRIVSVLKTQIQLPENETAAGEETSSTFAYNAHYCGVPRREEPEVLACSYFESGVRVFDIRDPAKPKEIAYFNPGGDGAVRPGSERTSGGSSGYTSSQVRFVAERGEIWFTDQDRGFYVARFTNGVWPFAEATAPIVAPVGLPAPSGCLRGASVRFRIPRERAARSAVVALNGKHVRRLRGRALRQRVTVKLPAGRRSVVRVVVTTRQGKRVVQTRSYTRC